MGAFELMGGSEASQLSLGPLQIMQERLLEGSFTVWREKRKKIKSQGDVHLMYC